ncbi:MAG: SIMPL domain-containing protein [Proteobacteria bacterium]|nr:SIMPL domain-containing protein [Pseudomonadota bacterium]
MSLKPLLIIAALGAATPAVAADGNTIAPGNTTLSLTAEGRSTRTPDIALFSAGVSNQGRTAAEALAANAAAMNQVVAALKRAGIEGRDIQTSNLSVGPVYANQNGTGRPKVVAYQVSNQVSVRERKVAELGKVLDALVEAGANDINGPTFSLDAPDAALDEARAAAMKAARARAQLYAGAAGLKVVRIVSISESGGFIPRPQPMMMAKMAMADAAPSPVEAGEVASQVSVNVVFELGPQ